MHNTYLTMKWHLEKEMFKRGANKGKAPAFERSKDHHLIIDGGDCMHYRMYSTNLITAYPDGRVHLYFGGYAGSSTTRSYFRDATYKFMKAGAMVRTDNQNGYRNNVLSICGQRTALTGQTVRLTPTDSGFTIISEDLRPLKAYRADRAKNKRIAALFEPIKAIMPFVWDTTEKVGYINAHSAIATTCRWEQLDVAPEQYVQFALQFKSGTHTYDYNTRKSVYTPNTWQDGWAEITKHISRCNRVVVELPC